MVVEAVVFASACRLIFALLMLMPDAAAERRRHAIS